MLDEAHHEAEILTSERTTTPVAIVQNRNCELALLRYTLEMTVPSSLQDNVFIITGCSGGGKSTLCEALSARGWSVVQEAGRQIVREELAASGTGLPWVDPEKFANKAVTRHFEQLQSVLSKGVNAPIVTDRSIVDLISFLEMNDRELQSSIGDMLAEVPYHAEVLYMFRPGNSCSKQMMNVKRALRTQLANTKQLKLLMFGEDFD